MALHGTLQELGWEAPLLEIGPDVDLDYLDYNLVLLGTPVHQFLPAEPVVEFLKRNHRARATVVPAAPEVAGSFGVVFCTYGGPHTGLREAVPALRYMGQFLEHAGVRVVDEFAVVGQFHDPGRAHLNVEGRLGDIRGRPGESDLKEVSERLRGLVSRLQHKLAPRGPAR
jgi:hypothetical protein